MLATAYRYSVPLVDCHNSVVNIESYGAIPNTGVDNSVAIQAALDAAAGGTVLVPIGTYEAANLVPPPYTRIVGVNKWKSIIKLPDASNTVPLFNISGIPGTPREKISFNNLHLKHKAGMATGNTSGRNILIFGDYTKLIQVSDCVFDEFSGSAIFMSHVSIGTAYWSWMIHNNIFYNASMANFTYGVNCTTAGEYADISGNFFTNLINGVYINNSANIRINNNTINGNQVGIAAVADGTVNAGKLIINGNVMHHNSGGGMNIQVVGDPTKAVSMQSGCVINNNIMLLPNNYGIKVAGGWGHTILGNRILTTAAVDPGIWLLDHDASNKLSYSVATNNNIMCNVAGTTGLMDVTGATGDGNVTTGNVLVTRPA